MLPETYLLTQEHDLAEGLDAIVQGRLFLPDENLSRVQLFFESDRTPDGANPMTGQRVLSIWLVRPRYQEGPAVGMAVVSRERYQDDEDHFHRYELLSLYVNPEHAGQGLGQALLTAAMEAHPRAMGFYNTNTVALYERAGVQDVIWMERDPTLQDPGVAATIAKRHQKIHLSRWDPESLHTGERPHHGRPAFTTPVPLDQPLPSDPSVTPPATVRRHRPR